MMRYRGLEEIEIDRVLFDEFIHLLIDSNLEHINKNPLKFKLVLSYNLNKCMVDMKHMINVCDSKNLKFVVSKDTIRNNEHFRKHISFEYVISDVVKTNRLKKIKTLL